MNFRIPQVEKLNFENDHRVWGSSAAPGTIRMMSISDASDNGAVVENLYATTNTSNARSVEAASLYQVDAGESEEFLVACPRWASYRVSDSR